MFNRLLLAVLAGLNTFLAVSGALQPDPNPYVVGLSAGVAVMIALFFIDISHS